MNIFRKAFMKKEKKTIRIYLVIVFVFYFKKFVFGNIKKNQFFCIFEIKNMFNQLKLKRQFFEEEDRKY